MSRYTGYLGKMAACAAALACVGGAAEANTVTFDWVSTSGPAATGSITLTSSLITSPDSFSVPKAQALADITGFSLTFANGEVMSLANATFANSTGWSDDSTGHLTSTWTASQSVTNPAGTLSVSEPTVRRDINGIDRSDIGHYAGLRLLASGYHPGARAGRGLAAELGSRWPVCRPPSP